MAQRGRGLADAARRAVGRAAKAVRGQDAEVTGDGRAGTKAPEAAGAPSGSKTASGKKSAAAKKSASAAAPATEATTSAKKATVAKKAKEPAAKKTAPVKKAPVKKAAPVRNTAPATRTPRAEATTKSTTTKNTTTRTSLTKKATTTNTRAKAATAKTATAKPEQSKPTARTTSQRHKPPAASLQVGSNEEPWSEEELSAIRAELEHDLQTMLSELALSDEQIAELIQDASNASGDDPADTGSKAFEREHEMTLANNTRDLIRQTRRALGRIAAGSYGTCESCGNAIGKRRLQAFPRATLCVTCKQEQERR